MNAAGPRLAAALLLTVGCGGYSAEPAASPAPAEAVEAAPAAATNGASFSPAQVDAGREQFGAVCGECHTTGEFRGDDFQFTWRRRTAWDFFRTVKSTMPENAPGSLSDAAYVSVVAYVLQLNGFEPGDAELSATEAALDEFVLDSPPGGR
jgi:mono/diheme cytochrome c family protein